MWGRPRDFLLFLLPCHFLTPRRTAGRNSRRPPLGRWHRQAPVHVGAASAPKTSFQGNLLRTGRHPASLNSAACMCQAPPVPSWSPRWGGDPCAYVTKKMPSKVLFSRVGVARGVVPEEGVFKQAPASGRREGFCQRVPHPENPGGEGVGSREGGKACRVETRW